MEAALEANEVDEDQLIEERRRRRQEILAKHGQAQGQQQAPQPGVHRSATSITQELHEMYLIPLAAASGTDELLCSVRSAHAFTSRLTSVASKGRLLVMHSTLALCSLRCLPRYKLAFHWDISWFK